MVGNASPVSESCHFSETLRFGSLVRVYGLVHDPHGESKVCQGCHTEYGSKLNRRVIGDNPVAQEDST